MLFLHEYAKHSTRLADHLPWAALIAPGVVLNKDGSFQTTCRFRGPDLASATHQELAAGRARLNNALKRLGTGWCLHVEALRRPANSYPTSTFPDRVSELIDEERRVAATAAGGRFESEYFLTLTYLPQEENIGRTTSFFIEDDPEQAGPTERYRKELEKYVSVTESLIDLLRSFFPEILKLSDCETLTYLHGCISTRRHRVETPPIPAYLDAFLTDDDLTGGLRPRLGPQHMRVISVRSFPDSSTPALLDELNALGFPYRWVSRFLPMDKEIARKGLATVRKRWFAKRKGIIGLLREALTREPSALEDGDAVAKAHDAEAALLVLGADAVAFGHFTPTLTLLDEDLERLTSRAREVASVINRAGLVAKTEDVNAVEAWLGSLPGHAYADVRRPLLSSLNLCDLLPLSAVWAGPQHNAHLTTYAGGLAQPALIQAKTTGFTPFRLDLHQGDVGHTLVIGPTGAGKSVLLNLLGVQWLRYPQSQVVFLDKGASSRAATLLTGGVWSDLGPATETVAFQPLASLTERGEDVWAQGWLVDLLKGGGFDPDPEAKAEIWSALAALKAAPESDRTLSLLTAAVQDRRVKAALLPFTVSGPFGKLFDSHVETIKQANWRAFEFGDLINAKLALAPALSYLFHRLEQGFTGAPTLLIMDEAWVFLANTQFAIKIRDWLKTLRKRNVAVVFATQSLDDILASDLSSAIVEGCPTKIYLPNPGIASQTTAGLYRSIGLNDREIEILASATPKRDYYYHSPTGCRLFELGLGPATLAVVGSSGSDDHRLLDQLTGSADAGDFPAAFFEAKGLLNTGRRLRRTTPSASISGA